MTLVSFCVHCIWILVLYSFYLHFINLINSKISCSEYYNFPAVPYVIFKTSIFCKQMFVFLFFWYQETGRGDFNSRRIQKVYQPAILCVIWHLWVPSGRLPLSHYLPFNIPSACHGRYSGASQWLIMASSMLDWLPRALCMVWCLWHTKCQWYLLESKLPCWKIFFSLSMGNGLKMYICLKGQ